MPPTIASGAAGDQETACWLALLRAPGLGPRRCARLLNHFKTPEAVLAAKRTQLAEFGLPAAALDALKTPDRDRIEDDLRWLAGYDCHLLTLADAAYPPQLLEIPDPPAALFVRGRPELLRLPQLALVGSRNPTASGRQTAREFARHLARAGLAITSGLAQGIDAAGHQGALDVKGITIAVAGTGLDRVYPACHRELAASIAEQGALVSEYPPGTAPRPEHFPLRNRIISGLSLGTLVVEAALRSGSLLTAQQALEQGREVFAIPGSIHNPLARGCHALIRHGAKLVEEARDIAEELGPLAGVLSPAPAAVPHPQAVGQAQLDEDYLKLLEALGHEPTGVDLLLARTGLTAEAVSSMLLLLELEGYVSSAPGGRYCRLFGGKTPVTEHGEGS